MSINNPQYPASIYDGLSPERDDRQTHASAGPEDFDQLVAEVIATQTELDARQPALARVTVTSAEILACNTTPVVLVAAPGAGLVNIVDRIIVRNEFLTGAYAYTTIANVSYTDESGAVISAMVALFLESAATAIASLPSTLLTGAAAGTRAVANAAIVFAAPDADPITGAGSLVFDVYYRTVATV